MICRAARHGWLDLEVVPTRLLALSVPAFWSTLRRCAKGEARPIVIFPEGMRTPPGERRDYQPGVAALYRDLGVPVVPVALDTGLYWPRRSFRRTPGTMRIEFLEPIAPGLDRKAFTAELERRIETRCKALAAKA